MRTVSEGMREQQLDPCLIPCRRTSMRTVSMYGRPGGRGAVGRMQGSMESSSCAVDQVGRCVVEDEKRRDKQVDGESSGTVQVRGDFQISHRSGTFDLAVAQRVNIFQLDLVM